MPARERRARIMHIVLVQAVRQQRRDVRASTERALERLGTEGTLEGNLGREPGKGTAAKAAGQAPGCRRSRACPEPAWPFNPSFPARPVSDSMPSRFCRPGHSIVSSTHRPTQRPPHISAPTPATQRPSHANPPSPVVLAERSRTLASSTVVPPSNLTSSSPASLGHQRRPLSAIVVDNLLTVRRRRTASFPSVVEAPSYRITFLSAKTSASDLLRLP